MIPMTLFWVLAVIFFVILEGVSVQLTSVWFAVGAVVSLLLSFFIGSIWAQIWVFLIVSFLCLLAVRPLAKKYFAPQSHKPTNVDSLIGREAVVKEEINNLESRGLVKVMGQDWTARSQTGENIPAGTIVTVDHIEGVKVFVASREA